MAQTSSDMRGQVQYVRIRGGQIEEYVIAEFSEDGVREFYCKDLWGVTWQQFRPSPKEASAAKELLGRSNPTALTWIWDGKLMTRGETL